MLYMDARFLALCMCAEIWITTEVRLLLREQGEEEIFQGESRIRRLNMGWDEKEKLEIWGGITNTQGHLKSHIEAHDCRRFLKYIQR